MELSQGLRRKWGYRPEEIVLMIETFLDTHLGAKRQFDVLMLDWGCVWGFKYTEKNPGRVRRVVALDVGPHLGRKLRTKLGVKKLHTPGMIWQVPYQIYFALLFWVGNRISTWLATLMLYLGFKFLNPL